MKSIKSIILFSIISMNCFALTEEQLARGVLSKENVVEHVIQTKNYLSYQFIKNMPIFAYKIKSNDANDIPEVLLKNLGKVDNTTYSDNYFKNNIGGAIALQFNGSEFDFYVISKDKFIENYTQINLSDVMEKNKKLTNLLLLSKISYLFTENNINIVGALKKEPVSMIKMSEVGFDIKDKIVIESPWEEQTKPAGKDAYLVYELDKKAYYMINVGEDNFPIGYVPIK